MDPTGLQTSEQDIQDQYNKLACPFGTADPNKLHDAFELAKNKLFHIPQSLAVGTVGCIASLWWLGPGEGVCMFGFAVGVALDVVPALLETLPALRKRH